MLSEGRVEAEAEATLHNQFRRQMRKDENFKGQE